MHNDKIYCFTCKKITLDINPIKIQDSRYNPKWQDRCIHCLSFKTVNATKFIEDGKTELHIPVTTDTSKRRLKALGNKMIKDGAIKEFRIMKVNKNKWRLYDRRRVRNELKKTLGEKESFK
jgi:hypothetical protein